MRFRLSLMLIALLLLVSPLAQAVECVMQQPVAAVGEAFHCPMMREMAPETPTPMSVAECLEVKAVAADAALVACPVHTPSLSAVLPMALVREPVLLVPVRSGAPPPYVSYVRSSRQVLALSGRLLI